MENFETYKLDQTGQQTQAILDQVSTNTADIAQLRALYEALTQSEPVIIQPSDTWPVSDPEENVIYRVIDRVNTPPQSYSDYMWNGTAMVLMATYNNSIDDEPTPGSNNLVKSGGVAASIVFDISAYHATGSTLATYANLAAALGTDGVNVPASVRKGGMSVKFVQSNDNKYVQYMLTKNEWSTNVTYWEKINVEEIQFNTIDLSSIIIPKTSGAYIKTFGSIGSVVDLTPVANDSWNYAIVDCQEGDVFYVQGSCNLNDTRVYCFIDSSNKRLVCAGISITTPTKIVAPQNAAKLILDDVNSGLPSYSGKKLTDHIIEKVDKVDGKSLIDEGVASKLSFIEDDEYIQAVVDAYKNLLLAIDKNFNGKIFIDIVLKNLAKFTSVSNNEWVWAFIDEVGNIVFGLDKKYRLHADLIVSKSIKEYIQEQFDRNNTFLKVSVLGDSISTFSGYGIDGYFKFYPNNGVNNVNDTWWKIVINELGGKLEVNASSTGSTASSLMIGIVPRVPLLGNPDMIFVALGTNDSTSHVQIGTLDYDEENPDLSKFAPAYNCGIRDIKALYPTAKVVCMILDQIDDSYASIIQSIAEHYGCICIDVRDVAGEEIHPDKPHMFQIAGKTLSIVSCGLSYILSNINQ